MHFVPLLPILSLLVFELTGESRIRFAGDRRQALLLWE